MIVRVQFFGYVTAQCVAQDGDDSGFGGSSLRSLEVALRGRRGPSDLRGILPRTSGNARPVWRGSPLTSFDSCKVGSFDHVRGWRRRMVDVAGDGTWSRVVRDIKDIVARALASLHRGGRPFAQSPDR